MLHVNRKFAVARWFMAFSLVTVFAVGLALGQAQSVKFKIPYSFTVGSTALPAGTYTFSISQGAFTSLMVQSSTTRGPVKVSILTLLNGPNELFRGGSLIFDKTGKGPTLSEVWLSGTDGALIKAVSKGDERMVLAAEVLNENRSYSGKAAFNLTCARCHGENGKGNPEADKFFGQQIPRLTSAEVQRKTDAELKQLISQGSNAMPPVEIDESGFRHRLPPQDVDAVIAYLHTLK